ncbi:MAG: Rrf2 family transcriptional regulator nitric oxide-sensitive transcriptional repressor [Rhodospirillaceae bacterium]|nr:MAG: Rrf2 family transcriptional regulator nitric oxide-sensitive transcriptional repressor [Rhodospirillaceae bacterium]
MRLTVYTDYSLRVLVYLGVRTNRLATSREIADYYSISNNHLLKVVHRLGVLGYIDTVRGKNGGIRLAHAPADIVIGMIIRETEHDMALVQCKESEGPSCRIEDTCMLRSILDKALLAFMAVLDCYTLADLISVCVDRDALLERLKPRGMESRSKEAGLCANQKDVGAGSGRRQRRSVLVS